MRQFPNLPSSYSSDISVKHINQIYACANFTLNLERMRYWIPVGRQHVKKAINHGVTCKTIIGLPYNTLIHLFFQRKDSLKQNHFQSLTQTLQELYTSENLQPKRKITSASLHVPQQEQSTQQSLQIFWYKPSFSRIEDLMPEGLSPNKRYLIMLLRTCQLLHTQKSTLARRILGKINRCHPSGLFRDNL